MDGFFSLVVPVNNQVKDIAGLGFHGDKLLAALGSAADVVNQRQVPIRGQGGAAAGLAASEQPQQGGKFFFIKREGEVALAGTFFFGVADGQVVGMDITYALRQKNFHPVAVCADHFHLRSVGKLGECGLIKPRAGADVQLSAVGSHGAGLGSFLRAAVGGDLDAVIRSGDAYLGAEQRGKQIGGLLAGQALGFIVLRFACGCGIRLVGLLRVRLHAAGCFGGSFRQRLRGRVGAACKSGNRKDREAEHHGQNCGQNPGNSSGFILHGQCPPVHGTL